MTYLIYFFVFFRDKSPEIRLWFPVFLLFSFCQPQAQTQEQLASAELGYAFPYNLNTPKKKFVLPRELDEISAIEVLPNGTIACVQDEKGNIYVYNRKEQKITGKYKFSDDGDFEGIARVGEIMYVLESDGDIYQVPKSGGKKETKKFETILSLKNDTEGLAYDKTKNQLLVACKGESGLKEDHKKHKSVFGFNLDSKEIVEEPILYIDLEEISAQLDKKKRIQFEPSGIAVHPISGNYYVIASAGNRLIVFDRTGKMLYQQLIKGKNFRQPEGICFENNGTLLISNEARDGEATILEFAYRAR